MPRHLPFSIAGVLLALVVCLPQMSTYAQSGAALSVNASQRFQRIDGFGVNANPKIWNTTNLRPALDLLTDDMHATIWRVDIFGKSNWIDSPAHLNAAYYSTVYETPDFRALWQTLGYLYQKGAQVILSASGVVPDFMGWSSVDADHEDEFVEMICSVVDYGRHVKGLPIRMLSPLNETDGGPPEGPRMDPTQQARLMHKIADRLQALGLDDVRLVGPEPSGAPTAYLDALFADPGLMSHIDHLALHSYNGTSDNVNDYLQSSAYPNKNIWMTEWSQATTDGFQFPAGAHDEWVFAQVMTDDLLNILQQGVSAALAWDAYDNYHEHDPCCASSTWGQLALDSKSGTFSPRKRYFTNAQVFKFVAPGSVRIGVTTAGADLAALAFYEPGSGQLSIVGHNKADHSQSVNLTLANVAALQTLHLYETNRSENMARRADVSAASGAFSVTLSADSFFTLTTAGSATSVPAAQPAPAPPPAAAPPPAPAQQPAAAPQPAPPNTSAEPAPSDARTLTFDDLDSPNRELNGQYPDGLIDWGSGSWWFSGPYAGFTTNSISFVEGPTSGGFKFLSPRRLVQLDATNGGDDASAITLTCDGLSTVPATLGAGQLTTIYTGWTAPCTAVTITSSNGWYTNFTNLVIDSGNR